MSWIALKMLMGDRSKYLGLIFGVTFASLLIAQQSSIFCGIMRRTCNQIRDTKGVNIWVMNPQVQYIDDLRPISDNDLYRVRSVPGVEWAVWLYKGSAQARLEDGRFQQVILFGIDDATLVGAPVEFTVGSKRDLEQPDAIAMDESGYKFLWPDQPLVPGRVLEMNDRRAVIKAIFKASETWGTMPLVYTRFSQATLFIPSERRMLPFILAQEKPGLSATEVARQISKETELQALTADEFSWKTQLRYLQRTSIPINFGTTVLLGFMIGAAIAGQTFFLFTLENLKQFGALKAMGVSNPRLVSMILLQGVVVGWIGYGLGVGLATIYGQVSRVRPSMSFYMPWQVLFGTGAAVMLIVCVASLLSIRRVVVLEPAIVFRG